VTVNPNDLSALKDALPVLEKLVAACRKGGSLHSESPSLAGEVVRKAGHLRVAIDNLLGGCKPLIRQQQEKEESEEPWKEMKCQDCGQEGREDEFLPTDGNPAPLVCPKCGRTNVFAR
jgi:hypothetical protein